MIRFNPLPSSSTATEAARAFGGDTDNCVSYHGKRLQIPPRPHRCHYVRAKVRVHEYENGAMAIFHGTRRLARYNANGRLLDRAGAAA